MRLPLGTIVLVLVAGLLLASTISVSVYHSAPGLVDATSIAILFPSIVLCTVILAAALKKQMCPWQSVQCWKSTLGLFGQTAIAIASPLIAIGLINIYSEAIGWKNHHPALDVLGSITCTLPIVFGLELLLFRITQRGMDGCKFICAVLFFTFIIGWTMFFSVPTLQLIDYHRCLSSAYDDFYDVRHLYRVQVALSVVPISLAGLFLACTEQKYLFRVLAVSCAMPSVFLLMTFAWWFIQPAEYYMVRAGLCDGLGQHEYAVKNLNESLRHRDSAKACFWRGFKYAQLNEHRKAIASFDRVLDFAEKPFGLRTYAHFNRACSYHALAELSKADADFDAGIKAYLEEYGPNAYLSQFYLARASLAAQRQRFDQALMYWHQAIEVGPETALAHKTRAVIHIESKQYDLAVEDCSKALSIDSRFAEAYCVRALAWTKLGQRKAAQADIQKAGELDPNRFIVVGVE
jgi:tetratricopeptide (TPR) repeat protein